MTDPHYAPAPILLSHSMLYHIKSECPAPWGGWLEAFRFAIETVDVSYLRLVADLRDATGGSDDRATAMSRDALIDAWACADGAHRALELLQRPPPRNHLKRARPDFDSLRVPIARLCAHVKGMRNNLQHADTLAHKRADAKQPIVGAIVWVECDPDGVPTGQHYLHFGTLRGEVDLRVSSEAAPGVPLSPVDLVTLCYGKSELALSAVHRECGRVTRTIEQVVIEEDWAHPLLPPLIQFHQPIRFTRT